MDRDAQRSRRIVTVREGDDDHTDVTPSDDGASSPVVNRLHEHSDRTGER